MKKLFNFIIIAVLMVSVLSFGHVHDDNCGYNFKTGTGCQIENIAVPTDDRDPKV